MIAQAAPLYLAYLGQVENIEESVVRVGDFCRLVKLAAFIISATIVVVVVVVEAIRYSAPLAFPEIGQSAPEAARLTTWPPVPTSKRL